MPAPALSSQPAAAPGEGPPRPKLPARVAFALEALARDGRMAGARTQRLSARVDPGIIAAARERTGIGNDSDLVNMALAVLAAPDDFGAWLVSQAGRLPRDFELGL